MDDLGRIGEAWGIYTLTARRMTVCDSFEDVRKNKFNLAQVSMKGWRIVKGL